MTAANAPVDQAPAPVVASAALAPGWLLPACGATLLFGVWAVLPRALGGVLGAPEQQILSTLGLLPVIAFLLWRGQPGRAGAAVRSVRGDILAAAAGLATGVGNLCYYRALSTGDASLVAPLGALYPIVTVILAVVFLHERLNRWQAIGIGGALLAMWLFAHDGRLSFGDGAVGWALLALLLWGLSAAVQKLSVSHVAPARSTLVYLAAAIPLALVLLPSAWAGLRVVSVRDGVLGALLGLALGAGNLSLTIAYGRAGPASVVTTLSALYWVVPVPIGVMVFGETIDARRGLALALALGATVALAQERRAHA